MREVEKYRKIVKDVVKKSFPRLKNKKIKVIEVGFGRFAAFFVPVINLVGVHKKMRGSTVKEFQAILAHELSHFDSWLEMSFLRKCAFSLEHTFSKRAQSDFETLADKRAIEKGYALGLYSYVKKRDKVRTPEQREKRSRNGYLSPEKIKSYARKIKKWQ